MVFYHLHCIGPLGLTSDRAAAAATVAYPWQLLYTYLYMYICIIKLIIVIIIIMTCPNDDQNYAINAKAKYKSQQKI